jgi:hypothetical protein
MVLLKIPMASIQKTGKFQCHFNAHVIVKITKIIKVNNIKCVGILILHFIFELTVSMKSSQHLRFYSAIFCNALISSLKNTAFSFLLAHM